MRGKSQNNLFRFIFLLALVLAISTCQEKNQEKMVQVYDYQIVAQYPTADSLGFSYNDSLGFYSHHFFSGWPLLKIEDDSFSVGKMKGALLELFWQDRDSLRLQAGDTLNHFRLTIFPHPQGIIKWQKERTVIITHSRPAYSWHIRQKGLEITRVRPRSQYYGFLQKDDFIVTVNDTAYQRAILGKAEEAVVAGAIPFIKLGVLRGVDTLSYRVVCKDTDYYKSWQNMLLEMEDDTIFTQEPKIQTLAKPEHIETDNPTDSLSSRPGFFSHFLRLFQKEGGDTLSIKAAADTVQVEEDVEAIVITEHTEEIVPDTASADSLSSRPGFLSRFLRLFQKESGDTLSIKAAADTVQAEEDVEAIVITEHTEELVPDTASADSLSSRPGFFNRFLRLFQKESGDTLSMKAAADTVQAEEAEVPENTEIIEESTAVVPKAVVDTKETDLDSTTVLQRARGGLAKYQVVDIGNINVVKRWRERFFSLTEEDRIFLILIVSVMFLAVIVVLLALITLSLRLKNTLKAKRFRKLENIWQPLVLDVLDGKMAPVEIQKFVARKDHLFFIQYLVRITRQLRGEEQVVVKGLSEPFLHLLLRKLSRSHFDDKILALHLLSFIGIKGFEKQVKKIYLHANRAAGIVALRAMCQPEYNAFYPYILEHIDRFKNWNHNILASILANGGPDVAFWFRQIVADANRLEWTQILACDTLRLLSDIEAASIISQRIQQTTSRELLTAFLRYLEVAGSYKHMEEISYLAMSDDYVVRTNVIRTIGNVAPDSHIELLSEALSDPANWVVLNAAIALAKGGHSYILMDRISRKHPRSNILQQVLAEYAYD
jgi:hypothetical protein